MIDALFRNTLAAAPTVATAEAVDALLARTLVLDVEADRAGRPRAVGAVLGDRRFRWDGHGTAALARLAGLDAFAQGADRIAGHNILAHDLLILRGAVPALRLLALPVVDTLMLSPLAFPANPYHRLIKDYKLVRDAVNDPVADARLCRDVLRDELFAFAQLARTRPAVAAFHRFALAAAPWTGMADLLALAGAPALDSPVAALGAWNPARPARSRPCGRQPGRPRRRGPAQPAPRRNRPGDLYIDFAGRRPPGDRTHRALAALRPGDPVWLDVPCVGPGRVSVRAADGTVVARLSAAASVPWSRLATAVERARVLAVVRRYRTDATAVWRDPLRADAWEVPILEIWTRTAR